MPNFSGIWTRTQQMQARGASTWPAVPGAPTIGTATAGSNLCASVTFSAPACAGYPTTITAYRVTSTPGCFTNTGASSPIVVSGLTNGTSYTFKVAATNTTGYGACSAASNSITASNAGSQSYTTAGTYTWVAPAGVTSVSVVAVGAGGRAEACNYSGGGGGLGYKNNISVTPGSGYTVVVGTSVKSGTGGNSYFISSATVQGGGGINSSTGGTYTGDGGGNGGGGCGSGGAGGYSGNGGNGTFTGGSGTSGSGGGGGGGGSTSNTPYRAAGGGGVGILGQGSNGAGGSGSTSNANGGGGGSGGSAGGSVSSGAVGGNYGGGGGRCSSVDRAGGGGAVRIIWPGNTRSFPSTNAGNP